MTTKQKILFGSNGDTFEITALDNFAAAAASMFSYTHLKKGITAGCSPFKVSYAGNNHELLITKLEACEENPNMFLFEAWELKKLANQTERLGIHLNPYEKVRKGSGIMRIESKRRSRSVKIA